MLVELDSSGFPIIDKSPEKINPVNEKPQGRTEKMKEITEKTAHAFIKNIICPDNFTHQNIF
tara:strand:- start:35 stop:220 length:186 start_codon:yes stop_codon:yes gene_type:complete